MYLRLSVTSICWISCDPHTSIPRNPKNLAQHARRCIAELLRGFKASKRRKAAVLVPPQRRAHCSRTNKISERTRRICLRRRIGKYGVSSAAKTFASELVATLKLTAPVEPGEVARPAGIGSPILQRFRVRRRACLLEGTIVSGTILVKDSIREAGRIRFTVAHEIAHYVLPHHGVNGSICRAKDVESWDESSAGRRMRSQCVCW